MHVPVSYRLISYICASYITFVYVDMRLLIASRWNKTLFIESYTPNESEHFVNHWQNNGSFGCLYFKMFSRGINMQNLTKSMYFVSCII